MDLQLSKRRQSRPLVSFTSRSTYIKVMMMQSLSNWLLENTYAKNSFTVVSDGTYMYALDR